MHFVSFEAFLKMGCGAEMKGTRVAFASNSSTGQYCYLKLRNSSVLDGLLPYLPTIPPHSLDSATKERKACRVCRFEDDSAIQENLHSHEVIAEQIRKSLQVEAKSKVVGLGPGTSVENILQQLDQFYGDEGAAVGNELLSRAYNFRQHESEEVSAWITKSDKQGTWR